MLTKIFLATFAVCAIVLSAGISTSVNAQNRCGSTRFNAANLLVIGLTSDQRLVCFSELSPSRLDNIGQVTGLSGDTALIGIDYRVQDGRLYGVGNAGGVYTISTVDGSATLVNNLTVALSGTAFGVDFNPAADRLRIISNTGQNLRHNVNTGGTTLNDGTLTYTAPPATPVAATGVAGAAYTNNDLDASTATTLFDIDSALDQVSIQSPANNGILVATGRLGVDSAETLGFDIYSSLSGGVTAGNRGMAALTFLDGSSRLYSISLLTGRASMVGGFAAPVIDLAIPLNQ